MTQIHVPEPSDSDATGIIEMLIDAAQLEIDRQFDVSDAHDVQGLGLLAANLAAIGFAIVLSPRWTPLWLLPMCLAVISIGAYLYMLRRRKWRVGPDIPAFYQTHGAGSLLEARRYMLAHLIRAIMANNALFPPKGAAFFVGTTAMVLEVVTAGAILGLLDHNVLP